MAGKRDKPEDIVLKLRQVEVLHGQGMAVCDAVRQIGVTEPTYCRWRKQYGGMSRDQLKRLEELETENQRLRRVVSDLTLDKMILIRIDRDGNAAEGNNAPEGFDPRIYTYRHRNVQGIAFHPETGQAITAEHGPWHSDEITALVPGGNGGWDPRPNTAGRGDCPDGYCGYEPGQMDAMDPAERAAYMPMTDLDAYPDAMPPAWNNNGLSQGMSSAVFLTGEQWGDWDGRLVVGFMGIGFGGTPVGQRIDLIDIAEDGLSVNDVTEMDLPMEAGRFRSLVLGPDGALYTAIDEGEIHRIAPE